MIKLKLFKDACVSDMALKKPNEKDGLEGAVIVTNNAKSPLNLSDQLPTLRKPVNPKKFFLVSLVVIFLILGLWSWYAFTHRPSKKTSQSVAKNICGTPANLPVLESAAANLDPANVAQLQPFAMQIQNIPFYQTDPNCLYPIVTYYINLGDAKNARANLTQLTLVYNADTGYSSHLGLDAKKPEQLDVIVKGLEDIEKSSQNNGYGVGPDGVMHQGQQ